MKRNPLEWLSESLLTIAGIPVLAMMAHVTLDVTCKYLINTPLPSTLEITSYYYMVSIVVLPIAFIELTRQSIAVDLFYLTMPYPMKVATMGFVVLASAATYAGFAAVAWPDAMKAYEIKEIAMGSEVTIWPTRFLLPVGLIVAATVCLLLFVRLFTSADARRLLTSEHVEDPDVGVH